MARALSCFNERTYFLGLSRSSPSPSLFCHRPLVVTMVRSQSYWTNIEAEIEANLKKSIPIRPPLSVFEPMYHLTFAAPKTAAPALCIVACELVGGDKEQAMAAAAAIHLMHAAAYTHEHLHLTDRARPKPAIQHKFNPNIELMIGDGIIPFALEILAKSMDSGQNNSDKILRVIIEITQAIGSQGMVDGQYRELEITQSDGGELTDDVGLIEYVCKKKEGELYSCGAACGAILGGGSEEEIEKLRKYGLYAGMIQGIRNGIGRDKKGMQEMADKLRALAKEELESFKSRNIETISSLV